MATRSGTHRSTPANSNAGRAVAGAAPGRHDARPGQRGDPAEPDPGRRPDHGHPLDPGPGPGPGQQSGGDRGARRRHRHRRGAQARAGRGADADRRRALGDRDLVVDQRGRGGAQRGAARRRQVPDQRLQRGPRAAGRRRADLGRAGLGRPEHQPGQDGGDLDGGGGDGRVAGGTAGRGGLMPRAVTTGGTAGGEWGLLAAMAAVVGASTALWVGGGLASAVSGPGWHSASFSPVLVLAVARSGTGSWWPGVDPGLVWGLTAALTRLLVVAALTAYLTWSLRRPASATTAGHGLVLSTIAILPGLRLTQRHDTPRGASRRRPPPANPRTLGPAANNRAVMVAIAAPAC